MVWFIVYLLFLGPLNKWPPSELFFYLAQERILIGLETIRALGSPSRREILTLRALYWGAILLYVIPSHYPGI